MTFKQDNLNYELNALEPFMSKETLEFHYGKHHLAYINNLNNLLENHELKDKPLEEIIKESYKQNLTAIFNNAAQHYNHTEFWQSLKVNSNPILPTKIKSLLESNFGSIQNFKENIVKSGMGIFGSGWVWLAQDGDKLEIIPCANALNPLVHNKNTLLGCDVWEHSYYIDYRNKRLDFLNAWVDNLINWEYVESKLI